MTLSKDTRKRIQSHIANLGHADAAVALRAERLLTRYGVKAIDFLIDAVNNPDPQVRFRAVWALGETKDKRALSVIVGLTGDVNQRVAYDAIMALGILGDKDAIPHLLEIFSRPEDERALVSASYMALRKLGRRVRWKDG